MGWGTRRLVEWAILADSIRNLSRLRGFVKISATFLAPSIFTSFTIPFSTHSFKNLYFISICLVLFPITDVPARAIVAELSSYIIMGGSFEIPISFRHPRYQTASWTHPVAAIISASVEDRAIVVCLLLNQETGPP